MQGHGYSLGVRGHRILVIRSGPRSNATARGDRPLQGDGFNSAMGVFQSAQRENAAGD